MANGMWHQGETVFSAELSNFSGEWGVGTVGSGSSGKPERDQWGVGSRSGTSGEWDQWGVGLMRSRIRSEWNQE